MTDAELTILRRQVDECRDGIAVIEAFLVAAHADRIRDLPNTATAIQDLKQKTSEYLVRTREEYSRDVDAADLPHGLNMALAKLFSGITSAAAEPLL